MFTCLAAVLLTLNERVFSFFYFLNTHVDTSWTYSRRTMSKFIRKCLGCAGGDFTECWTLITMYAPLDGKHVVMLLYPSNGATFAKHISCNKHNNHCNNDPITDSCYKGGHLILPFDRETLKIVYVPDCTATILYLFICCVSK